MKTPLEMFDVKKFIGEIGEANTRFVKGAELFASIDEIDVGRRPRIWCTRRTSSSSTTTSRRVR